MMLHILNRSAKSGLKKYDKQIMVISENHYGKMDGILDFLYASDCVVKIHLNQEFAEEDKKDGENYCVYCFGYLFHFDVLGNVCSTS